MWKPHPALEMGLCRLAIVLLQQPPEHVPSPDRTSRGLLGVGHWRLLAQALMWARLVVVRDVRAEDAP